MQAMSSFHCPATDLLHSAFSRLLYIFSAYSNLLCIFSSTNQLLLRCTQSPNQLLLCNAQSPKHTTAHQPLHCTECRSVLPQPNASSLHRESVLSKPIAFPLHTESLCNAKSQCCMQIGPANGIVQPGSEVSSELWNTLRTRWTVGPRSSSVFSLLHRRSWSSAAEYCIGEHESEGCVSLSGGAEHRLKAASAHSSKGCEHKCSSQQFGLCSVCSSVPNLLRDGLLLLPRPCVHKPEALGPQCQGEPAAALKAFPSLGAYKFQRRAENDPKMPPTDDKPPKVLPLTCDFPTISSSPAARSSSSFYS